RRKIEAITCALFLSFGIQTDGGADQLLEGSFVDLVAFMQIDGAPRVPLQAGIEEAPPVFDRSTLEESELHDRLVGLAGADDPVVGPDGDSAPLPIFDDLRVRLFDELADMGQRLAAPVAELGDSLADELGRRFVSGVGFLHVQPLLARAERWSRRGRPGIAIQTA